MRLICDIIVIDYEDIAYRTKFSIKENKGLYKVYLN